MAPAVLLRGDQRANHFYQNLLHSLEQTSETAKVEHYRLLWAGMPIWGKQRYLSNYFTQLNTSIVNSIYTSSWIFKFDPTNPLTTMAKAYSELFINLNEKEKFIFLKHIIQNWNVQGVIFHHSHSCKRNSDNTYGIGQRILKELYIPSITIEADHNNLKYFNTRHFTTSIEALLEQIKSMNSIKEKKSK
jgi:benzoyl-CoA reductase/2-hydroxyglutaryl-CoA dehydratase subunit BcrC/BadD/HgdB